MNAIRIHVHLDSDTPHLPQLRPIVGKDVEIIVREKAPAPSEGVERFLKSGGRDFVDPDAVTQLREISKI